MSKLLGVVGLSALLALAATAAPAAAADAPKVIAAGEWSKPVADKLGKTLRGRLVLCEKVIDADRRDVIVCIELQEASDSYHPEFQVYCELDRHDFRPEYKGGLQCKMLDKDKHEIPSEPFAFSGGVPGSVWMSFPKDTTIRLRTTPYGIRRDGGMAICPYLSGMWTVTDDDPNHYFLTGTFTVNPAAELKPPGDGHVWRGTIELPPMQIVSRSVAAKRS
ncbi:MAG: hypothetical protein L0211_23670 [Planctomycetaceae bacterium]|nr:hypothetical protein [Planctomycetaceae bacterium]